MKFDVSHIFVEHIRTLCDAKTGKISLIDIALFYFVPIVSSIIIIISDAKFTNEIFGYSISVYAIFSALLLNVQIALYGIYKNDVKETKNMSVKRKNIEKIILRKDLISELNSNISYLILVSIFSVILFIIFMLIQLDTRIESAAVEFLYAHFTLTILMVVKRAHALFVKEYE